MDRGGVSRNLFVVVLLVILLNATVSTAHVVEDGLLLRRALPAACWIVATVIWVTAAYRANRSE
ncbi:MAG: hypothetical protein PVH41_13785 [Anaerolineae bacterium]|jgi:hypothetical protein